mmetsp:Transcript_85910/g.188691  ORF Transcript_85910/g.188691 Transcript_85910/m.188691 type:complete len:270 (+) Transcript_85910:1-810(+)
MTIRLFTLLMDLFEEVREVKSDYFNALQASFYVCCTNFDAERFRKREVARLFGINFKYLLSTFIQDSNDLDILPQVDCLRTEETDQEISDMLDRINKLRLVHEQSRKIHEKTEFVREDPRAVVTLRPAPAQVSEESLNSTFSIYGRVRKIVFDDTREVSIHFANSGHAEAAVDALRGTGAFGENVWISIPAEENETEEAATIVSAPAALNTEETGQARFAAPLLVTPAPPPGFNQPKGDGRDNPNKGKQKGRGKGFASKNGSQGNEERR